MTSDGTTNERDDDMNHLSNLLKTKLIWLLCAAIVLGGLFPETGLWIAGKSLGVDSEINSLYPKILLGLIVFLSTFGHASKPIRYSNQRWLISLGMPVLVRAIIFGLVLAIWQVAPPVPGLTDILFGTLAVTLMPAAFSSIAWANRTEGNSGLSIAIVVVTVAISAVIVPPVLDHFANHSVSANKAVNFVFPVDRVYALFFHSIIPSFLLGFVVGSLSKRFGKLTSQLPRAEFNAVLILLLNYVNASLAIPALIGDMQGTMLIIACLFFLALCVLSLLLAKQASRMLKLDNHSTKSATLASGMFNTGLAQVMLILAMPGNAFVIFPAIVITVIQHACVAIWMETADALVVVNAESQSLRVPRKTNPRRTASSIGASKL